MVAVATDTIKGTIKLNVMMYHHLFLFEYRFSIKLLTLNSISNKKSLINLFMSHLPLFAIITLESEAIILRLNNDCIRDLLLTVEEETGYNKMMIYNNPEYESNNFKLLSKYSYEEMIYHINQCEKSDLIEVGISPEEYTTISDLTPKGHKYISDIRSDNVWGKTKSIANKIGAKSLDAMIQISSNVISEIIKHEFGYL